MTKTQEHTSPTFTYLLGLITGRGHIFSDSKTIAIEFSHKDEFAEGIAHCPKCGDFATKPRGSAKSDSSLVCKNCGSKVNPNVKKLYNQPELTIKSLNEVIIPFLKSEIGAKYDIIGNKSLTLLILDFKDNGDIFDRIKTLFGNQTSFDAFHIPEEISSAPHESKIEFINGLLDTAGFASPGGWLNRDGEKLHGRMRVYFQLVRNWHLPVEIDNFLRKEFNLPIHTIDWGHPNIRDSNMEDYFNARPTSWGREHQVKFFPEYYTAFKFRIESKQLLFKELADHNKKAVFTDPDDWFPPGEVRKSQIKPYHPGEADLRIPEPARRHFNTFWQVNAAMGCKYIQDLATKSKDPEYFLLTGKNDDGDIKTVREEFDQISKGLEQEILKAHPQKPKSEEEVVKTIRVKASKEKELYEPLVTHLKKYLENKYDEPALTYDTSAGNLNLFLKNNNSELLEIFDWCEKFRIRPDVVGFLVNSGRVIFEEAKITPLDIKNLGQLLGYCFVAKPDEAILISSVPPSMSLIKILKARPDLLEYWDDKKIQIGTWIDGDLKLIDI